MQGRIVPWRISSTIVGKMCYTRAKTMNELNE